MASHEPYGFITPGLDTALATPPLFLPQTGSKTIFTVTGGPIMIINLFGIVTTVIGSVTNLLSMAATATGLTQVLLTGTGISVDAAAVGSMIALPQTASGTAVLEANGVNPSPYIGYQMNAGVIQIKTSGSDGGTGQIQWYMVYKPMANFTPINATGFNFPFTQVTAASS